MTEEYESMTVAQLKELLKEQGLPVSGKKAELIERLMESSGADEEEVVEAAEEAAEEDDFFEEDEDWDDDEDEGHVAKQKPVLDEATQEAFALRVAQKKKTLSFRRTEWF
jgi:beta-lactam-binding protein with PASTA domain